MKKTITVAILALLTYNATYAQEKEESMLQSFNYIEIQGGGQVTFGDAKFSELLMPIGAISYGRYFAPAVGARIHVSGYRDKGGFDNLGYYHWNYVTADLDVMLNLTNLFCNKKHHFLHTILLGGIGLNTAWGNDQAMSLSKSLNYPSTMQVVWDGTKLSHNIRAGIRLETDQRKMFGVSLEVDANSLNDRFDSRYSNNDDWQITAMLGISFRFGHKYPKSAPAPEPEPIIEPTPEPQPIIVPRVITKQVEKKVPVTLHEENFYLIRESDLHGVEEQMKRIVQFLNDCPESTITVTGYADEETGNAKLNAKYASLRAETYTKELIDNYGCDPARIITDSKGDTVQPFEDNDKNRCVIVEGQGEKTITETVEETIYEKVMPDQVPTTTE